MAFCGIVVVVLLASVVHFSSARAVNISNTWMLPEEGFPVFYRYFRDRISWYEADAVCQFHHAYLVTADGISQYDAIRAYLKEMDITDSVWIGLSKTSEKPNFTWTDFQPLSGDGHWQETIPATNKEPMCVAMDPAKDFLWRPMSCGGPEVSSFICEMPIPSWALGPKGCLLTELPSLTVLYIPEQSSLELTSDCGLDGTKRIACKGNADREEILKQLTCTVIGEDFQDKPVTKPPVGTTTNSEDYSPNSKTTKSSIWTSNTVDIDYGVPTRHRRETEDTLSPVFTKSTIDFGMGDKGTESVDLSTGTNYDTELTTNSFKDSSTTESTIVSEKYLELDLETTTNQNFDSSSVNAEASTFTIEIEAKITVDDVTDEYPGAINQGHLFSIIRNGTIFDIIDLNETEHITKPTGEATTISTPENTKLKTAKKLIQKNDKTGKDINEQKQKSISKTEIYKTADPKKQNLNPVKIAHQKKGDTLRTTPVSSTVTDFLMETQNPNKEYPLYPIIKDSFSFLNRTFRKHLTDANIQKKEPTEIESMLVHDISNSVEYKSPDMQFENVPPKEDESNKEPLLKEESMAVTHLIDIDPKIDILNNNASVQSNESEIIEFVSPPEIANKTFDGEILKNLPTATSVKSNKTTDQPLEKDMTNTENEPRPNRQRQLTRPQRKTFYPYFFSRVLG